VQSHLHAICRLDLFGQSVVVKLTIRMCHSDHNSGQTGKLHGRNINQTGGLILFIKHKVTAAGADHCVARHATVARRFNKTRTRRQASKPKRRTQLNPVNSRLRCVLQRHWAIHTDFELGDHFCVPHLTQH
jgi:hypothetical protein